MAELTLTTFLTIDGVMQAPGGPDEDTSGDFPYGGWLVPHADDDMGKTMVEIFSKADAFLLGRTTSDIYSAYWPRVTDPNDPIAGKLNSLPKFVASHTQNTFGWSGSSHVRDVTKEMADIKKRFPREVQVHGSCGLAQTLIKNDLIDEYRLLTFRWFSAPERALRRGRRAGYAQARELQHHEQGRNCQCLSPRWSLKTGSFALD